MKIKNMAKVLFTGLGLAIAASAYAMTCQQCANQLDSCLMQENGASECLIQYRQCVSSTGSSCQMN